MAATKQRKKHSLNVDVPFIIESFPAPPTHIPSSPLPTPIPSPSIPPSSFPNNSPSGSSIHNPPLSRPPSVPLPPLPGPSPITDHESLSVLLSTRQQQRVSGLPGGVSKFNVDRISIVSSTSSHNTGRDSICSTVSVPLPHHSTFSVKLSRTASTSSASSLKPPSVTMEQERARARDSIVEAEDHGDFRLSQAYEGIVVDNFDVAQPLAPPVNISSSSSSPSPRSPTRAHPPSPLSFGSETQPISRSPSPPMSESELTLDLKQKLPFPSSSSSPVGDDSISSISMDDLPPADEHDTYDASSPLPSYFRTQKPSHSNDADADADSDSALRIHLEMRATRSRSESHKRRLLSTTSRTGSLPSPSTTTSSPSAAVTPPQPSTPAADATATVKGDMMFSKPRLAPSIPDPVDDEGRVPSPDIMTIINRTPRPSIRAKRSVSDGHVWSHSLPASRSNSRLRSESRASLKRSKSGRGLGDTRWSAACDLPPTSFRSVLGNKNIRDTWDEDGFLDGYAASHHTFGGDDDEGDASPREEEAAESGDDSDSDLDLHTPLTHLMLRDGMLSPNSKVLPQNEADRPGSTLSVVSEATHVTKSGLQQVRDTPQRRVRHRDGKTLRGGLGLTTGLGWSDSEDENAPSPLTKRISNLALSKSMSSTGSAGSSGGRAVGGVLSRSTSSGTMANFSRPSYSSYSLNSSRSMSSISRSSSQNSLRQAFPSSMSRETLVLLEMEEEDSYYPVEDDDLMRTTRPRLPRSAANASATTSTATSASTSSIVTPDDYDEDRIISPSLTGGANLRRDKTLPPLPGIDGEVGAMQTLRMVRKQASSSVAGKSILRDRSVSIASSRSGTTAQSATSHSSAMSTPTAGMTKSPPRALKLPQQRRLNGVSPSSSSSSTGGDRAAVPVPGLGSAPSSYSAATPKARALRAPSRSFSSGAAPGQRSVPSMGLPSKLRAPSSSTSSASPSVYASTPNTGRSSAGTTSLSVSTGLASAGGPKTPSTPSTPGTPGKPRIGTGMVYRKSGSGSGSIKSSSSFGYNGSGVGRAI